MITMEYPEETITTGAKGKKETRIVQTKGADFIVYKYLDISNGKFENKYSILLKKENGETEHLIIVPTTTGKELVVKHEIEKSPPKRSFFDEKTKKVVDF